MMAELAFGLYAFMLNPTKIIRFMMHNTNRPSCKMVLLPILVKANEVTTVPTNFMEMSKVGIINLISPVEISSMIGPQYMFMALTPDNC